MQAPQYMSAFVRHAAAQTTINATRLAAKHRARGMDESHLLPLVREVEEHVLLLEDEDRHAVQVSI